MLTLHCQQIILIYSFEVNDLQMFTLVLVDGCFLIKNVSSRNWLNSKILIITSSFDFVIDFMLLII